MAFFSKMFSKPEKPDYFADMAKEVQRLEAARDTQALIRLMQEVQGYRPPEIEDFAAFSQKRNTAAYQSASALAELGEPDAVEPVLECVKAVMSSGYGDKGNWWDPGPQVVARFGSTAVDSLISRLLKDELGGDMGTFAASTLGLIGDKRAVDPLLKLCEDGLGQNYFRPMWIWALGTVGEDRRVVEVLVSALIDNPNSSKSEAEALFALGSGRFGKPAEDRLLALLNDQELYFSKKPKVAKALCALGNPEGMEYSLREDGNVDLVLLGRFKDPRVTERLVSHLGDSHGSDSLKAKWLFAALGLAEQGDRRSVRPLVEALTISQWGRESFHPWYWQTMHGLALQALKKLGDTAIRELTELSRDSDDRIGSQAQAVLLALQS